LQDLVLGMQGTNVRILQANGSGGYTNTAFDSGMALAAAVVADFNSDGQPDVAVAGQNTGVFLNNLPAIKVKPAASTAAAAAKYTTLDLYAQVGSTLPSILLNVNAAVSGVSYNVATGQSWLAATPNSGITGNASSVTLAATAISGVGASTAIVRFNAAGYYGAAA